MDHCIKRSLFQIQHTFLGVGTEFIQHVVSSRGSAGLLMSPCTSSEQTARGPSGGGGGGGCGRARSSADCERAGAGGRGASRSGEGRPERGERAAPSHVHRSPAPASPPPPDTFLDTSKPALGELRARCWRGVRGHRGLRGRQHSQLSLPHESQTTGDFLSSLPRFGSESPTGRAPSAF